MSAERGERIYSGEFASLQEFEKWLADRDWFSRLAQEGEQVWAVLTRKPRAWLAPAEMMTSLKVMRVQGELTIVPYEQGVIFCAGFQVRWRPVSAHRGAFDDSQAKVWVDYIGEHVDDCAPLEECLVLGGKEAGIHIQERHYLLWGEQLANGLYGEGRIPIEIDYPLATPARRVRVVVRSFVDETTGRPVAERWLRLEGVE